MSAIEALYMFDEHNNCILEHIWTGRPPSAKTLLPLYLSHPSPRPSVIYAPDTNPPTLLYSIIQDRLLFLSPSSRDTDPLATLEFLHRVADALEDYLGSPLLASKIETSYDVVAQLLLEMCDGGTVANTEPNALREVVEVPSWMKSLVGGLGLSGAPPSLGAAPSSNFAVRSALAPAGLSQNNIAIPWRKTNVRHTSNELYVDIIETLHVILSPSGRPLSALAHGTIAFTCKVSGVPDLLLVLTTPAGQHAVGSTMQLPVFHPCVRLARWKERPGELSFVPPDGRFLLGGYEVDLLASDYLERAMTNPKVPSGLQIPASVDMRTGLGSMGSEFEVRLLLDPRFASRASTGTSSTRDGFNKPTGISAKNTGTTAHPIVEDVVVRIPVAPGVRNLTDIKPSRGEAHYSPGDGALEWRIGAKDAAALTQNLHSAGLGVAATLHCTVVGASDDGAEQPGSVGTELRTETWEYDDDPGGTYQSSTTERRISSNGGVTEHEQTSKKATANNTLMPSSVSVSFQVKGWLASGIKVDSLGIDAQRSRGLGAGVTPYKGVKYLTVSDGGIEARC